MTRDAFIRRQVRKLSRSTVGALPTTKAMVFRELQRWNRKLNKLPVNYNHVLDKLRETLA